MPLPLRLLLVPTLVVLVALMVPDGQVLAQSRSTAATAVSSAPAAASSSTSNRCTNAGHSNPCWAWLQRGSYGKPWCHGYSLVPFFENSTLRGCYNASNDLVEITCYYNGSPVAYGDNYEDHVIAVEGGSGEGNTGMDGHFPDFFVNLGGNNPPNVGIHYCS